jgi:hypothetical protein
MALDDAELESQVDALAADPPPTIAACATAWADAVEAHFSAIVPASTTVSAARATLESALAVAFASPAAAPGMEIAFAAFAVTVGGGMAPAFVATPPPAPVGFAAQFLVQPPTHAAAAAAVAALLGAWARTGTATPSGGGAPVPWS